MKKPSNEELQDFLDELLESIKGKRRLSIMISEELRVYALYCVKMMVECFENVRDLLNEDFEREEYSKLRVLHFMLKETDARGRWLVLSPSSCVTLRCAIGADIEMRRIKDND